MLGILAVRDAERLRSRMEREGVTVVLAYNHSTCKTGCSPSQEIWAHPDDVETIGAVMQKERMAVLQDLGADPELLEQVFDTSKATATCPACGTEFATTAAECPECGLGFEVPQ